MVVRYLRDAQSKPLKDRRHGFPIRIILRRKRFVADFLLHITRCISQPRHIERCRKTGLDRGPALAEPVAPVAQALVQLTTGMPVCPINCRWLTCHRLADIAADSAWMS